MIHQNRHLPVAPDTILPCDLSVEFDNPNGIVKVAHGEGAAMPPPVNPFHHPVPEKIFRAMTIIANRDGLVAPVIPGVKNLAHHMAVCAGRGIVRKIGRALRVMEGKRAEPGKTADNGG